MNFKFRIFLFLGVLAFTSCESNQNIKPQTTEENNKSVLKTEVKKETKEEIIFSIDTSEGHHICYISKIIITERDTSLVVDFVNYLIGIDAHKASINEGNYELDGKDTVTDITNDYYISNINKKLTKFSISENTEIFIYDYEMDGKFKQISIFDFLRRNKENKDFYELYNISFKYGKTLVLEELFLP